MRKISKASELLWLMGIVFVALGVAICNKADVGVSMIAAPAFVVSEALSPRWSGLSVGTTDYIIQGLFLILLCLIVGRLNWRYLLAFAVAVIYGYTLDLFILLLGSQPYEGALQRWLALLIGDGVTGFGVACFFRTYMPLPVSELFVAEYSNHFGTDINKVKRFFDLSLLAISIALAFLLFGDAGDFDWSSIGYTSFHSIGLGTLVTTVINAPIIAFMSKLIDKCFGSAPRFEKLAGVLSRH